MVNHQVTVYRSAQMVETLVEPLNRDFFIAPLDVVLDDGIAGASSICTSVTVCANTG